MLATKFAFSGVMYILCHQVILESTKGAYNFQGTGIGVMGKQTKYMYDISPAVFPLQNSMMHVLVQTIEFNNFMLE